MIDAGDAKTARVQLQWVVDKGKDELRELARLRLATLLLDEKAYDEALKLLDGKVDPAFEARFADSRGDIFAAQGKKPEAATAYKSALDKLAESKKNAQGWQAQSSAVFHEIVQMKLDSLGVGK